VRILLVEDEALIALHTEDVLLEHGHIVVGPADRLDHALALARQEVIDAAVLDINLAGKPVWPVAEVLQSRAIGFVLLSGFGASLEVPLAFKTAPSLRKPVHPEDLLSALTQLANLDT
jgi:two-component system, chemotaxis family, sensor kinase Cph1